MHIKILTAPALVLLMVISPFLRAQSGTEASPSRLTNEKESSWRTAIGAFLYLAAMQRIDSEVQAPLEKFEISASDAVIDKPGIYHIAPAAVTLVVSVDKKGIVRCVVNDAKGNAIVQSNVNPSAYQRWKIYWSKSGELWLNSSDIGIYVWEPQNDGSYKQRATLGKIPKEAKFKTQK